MAAENRTTEFLVSPSLCCALRVVSVEENINNTMNKYLIMLSVCVPFETFHSNNSCCCSFLDNHWLKSKEMDAIQVCNSHFHSADWHPSRQVIFLMAFSFPGTTYGSWIRRGRVPHSLDETRWNLSPLNKNLAPLALNELADWVRLQPGRQNISIELSIGMVCEAVTYIRLKNHFKCKN